MSSCLALLTACVVICLTLAPTFALRPPRLIAIGDLHGDVENTHELLRLAQVVNQDGHWASGTDTVIQMGDVVDRGPHGHTIMNYLRQLAGEAAAAGGELIQLLGNHELMNFQGDSKFVSPEHIAAFGGLENWKAAWASPSGPFGSQILQRPIVAIRNHSLFVHAGVTAEVAAQGPVLDLNDKLHALMLARRFTHPLLLDGGPVWSRKIIYSAQQGQCEPTFAALQEINRQERLAGRAPDIRRMVVGHTIQPDGTIRVFCNASLYAVDVCISQYMPTCGHLAHLEFHAAPGGEIVTAKYPPIPDAKHDLHRAEPYSVPKSLLSTVAALRSSAAGNSMHEWTPNQLAVCGLGALAVVLGVRWLVAHRRNLRRVLGRLGNGAHDRSV